LRVSGRRAHVCSDEQDEEGREERACALWKGVAAAIGFLALGLLLPIFTMASALGSK
jgi:hypothetical protein